LGVSAILEQQYRRTLRSYPPSWRVQNEDAIIGTLLDVAEGENRTRARISEQLNLTVNGLLTRVGIFVPVGVREGVATVALATGTAFGIFYFVFFDWSPWTVARRATLMPENQNFGPFVNPGVIVCGLWAVAFIVALAGKHTFTRIIMVLVIVTVVAIPFVNQLPFVGWAGPSSTNLGFFGLLAALSLTGTPRRRAYLSSGAGIALLILVALYARHGVFQSFYMGDRSFWRQIFYGSNLLVVLVGAYLVAIGFGLAGKRVTASVISLSTLPWAAAWLVGVAATDGVGLATVGGTIVLIAGFFASAVAIMKRFGFEIIVRRRDDFR
jgi:hypothetical protein